jgi:hypothetical protein
METRLLGFCDNSLDSQFPPRYIGILPLGQVGCHVIGLNFIGLTGNEEPHMEKLHKREAQRKRSPMNHHIHINLIPDTKQMILEASLNIIVSEMMI